MSKQSGSRSQNDPKAGPNANDKISNQSSEQAQQAGSTDHSRSVRSGLSGQASQPHVAAGNGPDNFKEKIAGNMDSGTGMTAPSDKGGKRSNSNNDEE